MCVKIVITSGNESESTEWIKLLQAFEVPRVAELLETIEPSSLVAWTHLPWAWKSWASMSWAFQPTWDGPWAYLINHSKNVKIQSSLVNLMTHQAPCGVVAVLFRVNRSFVL